MGKKYDFINYIGLGLVLLSVVVLIPHTLMQLNTLSNGEKVSVIIEELPKTCSGYKNFCRFRWTGETFVNQVGKDFCQTHKNGDVVTMKHTTNFFYDIFLFEFTGRNELLVDLISSMLLGVLGVTLTFKLIPMTRSVD